MLPMLGILLGLGTWQWRRMEWKTALLARLAASEAAPPVALGVAPAPWTHVVASGRFDHGREATLGVELRGTTLGTRLIVPLLREDGAPVLVDRGWVPLERAAPVTRPEGAQRVVGFVRPGERAGWFAATDDPATRRFYTLDPQVIGAALGLPAVAPDVLVALGPGVALGSGETLPIPARHLPRPANNHLGYVITWYGLACALLGVFAVWAWRRLRS